MRFFIPLCFLIASCDYFTPKQGEESVIVASVGDQELAKDQVEGLIPNTASREDSATFVGKFVDDWVKKQLMISKAKEAIDFNEAEIEQKVLDYRYALLVHHFEKDHIEKNIDTDVSDDEIDAYYAEKSDNFILRQNLTKCLYFKFPASAPNLSSFRRNLKNYPADSLELVDYSNQFALKGFLDQSIWVPFEEVILETPMKDISDKAKFLKTNTFVESADEDYVYFLKVFEYRVVGEIAPIEFVRENISDIIINKRKIALKKELERNIYEEAKSTNAFEVFSN